MEIFLCKNSKVSNDQVLCLTGCKAVQVNKAGTCPFDGVPLEGECPCSEDDAVFANEACRYAKNDAGSQDYICTLDSNKNKHCGYNGKVCDEKGPCPFLS